MTIIKYGFNRQLSILSTQICYKAFGIKIPNHSPSVNYPPPSLTPIPTLSPTITFSYKSQIALALYNHYRQQNFRFTDKGTTPKNLAQQMSIYIQQNNDINWEIDQFGNFIFVPTLQYRRKVCEIVKQGGRYEHVKIGNGGSEEGKEKHVFWYCVDQKMSVSQFRKIIYMEWKARILQQINGNQVIRNIVIPDSQKCSSQLITRITSIVFGTRTFSLTKLPQLLTTPHPHTHNYIGCHPQHTIPYQKNFPNFTLLNTFLGYEPTPLSTLSNTQLRQILNRQPKGLIYNIDNKAQNRLKKIIQHLVENELLWVYYGNLIDQCKFREVEDIAEIGGKMGGKVGESLGEMGRVYRDMMKMYFQ